MSQYSIKNHRLEIDGAAVRYVASPNYSQSFAPEGIVVHDTAGQLTKYSSVGWFEQKVAKSSAHFVVERDGEITQMVPLNRRAWHAGISSYNGRSDVNAFAFGIEIVNLGKCDKVSEGTYRPWFKKDFKASGDLRFEAVTTPNHGSGHWLDYTAEQISAVSSLCSALQSHYDVSWITTHWHISPGRKVDTNPLFPLDDLRNSVFGSAQDGDFAGTTIASINLRRWPSYNDNIIMVIPKGVKVSILRAGQYANEGGPPELWYCVNYGDQEGWVNAAYIS